MKKFCEGLTGFVCIITIMWYGYVAIYNIQFDLFSYILGILTIIILIDTLRMRNYTRKLIIDIEQLDNEINENKQKLDGLNKKIKRLEISKHSDI